MTGAARAPLHFDEASHTYTVNGEVLPGCTSVLSVISEYEGIPKHTLERAAQLGSAVHKAIELRIQNRLDEASMHPDVAERFYLFWSWWNSGDFEPEETEYRCYSEKYRYACTLDLTGKFRGKRSIIELKTTSKLMDTVGPQTAAQEKAYREDKYITNPNTKINRYALLLQAGGLKLEPLTSTKDWNVFLSCLTIVNHVKSKRIV